MDPSGYVWSDPPSEPRTDPSVRWRRPIARLLDATIFLGPVVWIFWMLAGPPPGPGVDDYRLMFQIMAGIGSFFWLGVGWPLYEVLAVAMAGRTIGKWVMALCVVGADRSRLSTGRLIGRALLSGGAVVVTGIIALRAWFLYPPLVAVSALALGLSQAIPAALGERTWLDLATGSDVVWWGRFAGKPSRPLGAFEDSPRGSYYYSES